MRQWDLFDFVTQRRVGTIGIENGKIHATTYADDMNEAVNAANQQPYFDEPVENEHIIGERLVKASDIKFNDLNEEASFLQSVLPDGYEIWPEGSEGPQDEDFFAFEDKPVPEQDELTKELYEAFSQVKLSEGMIDDDDLGDAEEAVIFEEEYPTEPMLDLDEDFDEDSDEESREFANPYHDTATGEFTFKPGGALGASARYALKRRSNSLMRSLSKNRVKALIRAPKKAPENIFSKEYAQYQIKEFVADYVADLTVRVARKKVNAYIDHIVTKAVKSKDPTGTVMNLKIDESVIRDIIDTETSQDVQSLLGKTRREIRRATAIAMTRDLKRKKKAVVK